MKILFASNNIHKIKEVKSILINLKDIEILSPSDFGLKTNIAETGSSLEENALIKAKSIYNLLGIPALADDTGLFVNALDGEPGVHSARYAGENSDYEKNNLKLLKLLNSVKEEKRIAHFKTVLCLYKSKNEYNFFEGICEGKILARSKGSNGFGYDSLFLPSGSILTFAEMSELQKNDISHRRKSLEKLKNHLLKK
ncbi:MAG: dITP/XTP pyrophosphatase [Ignavibacteria bacterium]|nr:dITP/XTP pyrophosphatase [Ignavibacteria bacterium]